MHGSLLSLGSEPRQLSVMLFGSVESRKRSLLKLNKRELDWWALRQAEKVPIPKNAIQIFTAAVADSIPAASSVTPTTTETSIFTTFSDCNLAFPVGVGLSHPRVNQSYFFRLGGLITTPATGTLIITPYYGQGVSTTSFTGAVSLGASPAQTVTASLSNIPWWIDGALTFRTIGSGASTSTCWCTGVFHSQGTLATAGGGWTIPFGSTAPVTVDTTGGVAAGSGCVTFSVHFSVTGGTFITEWTSMATAN